jgi:hypothetical protein
MISSNEPIAAAKSEGDGAENWSQLSLTDRVLNFGVNRGVNRVSTVST